MTTENKMVITISRQLASGGAYIGHLVARKLDYKYVEREVLHAAALQLGVDIKDISAQDEKKSSFLESMLKSFLFGTPEAAYVPPSRKPVYDEELFTAECRIIRQIAERHNTVIVGHAGFAVLGDRPNVFNVYIHAPKDFRIARLIKFHDMSEEQAVAEIEESDHRREKYLRTRTERDWHDARNFHLCLDARATGFEAAADTIIALAAKFSRLAS
jgi:cytidylate kinase